jgi:hypothetical protein
MMALKGAKALGINILPARDRSRDYLRSDTSSAEQGSST